MFQLKPKGQELHNLSEFEEGDYFIQPFYDLDDGTIPTEIYRYWKVSDKSGKIWCFCFKPTDISIVLIDSYRLFRKVNVDMDLKVHAIISQ